MSTQTKTDDEILTDAITRANEMVIGASFAIMEAPTEAAKTQASWFQHLFSSMRDVLSDALHGPNPSRSRATMDLARAVLEGQS
ncbi:hypothetical protein [Microbacterium sp. YJN-G]|uniref:hypothetical protein n=1 Tax=Microbacterium sp. YJN-G TaxID=2763257 RepID=UPI001877B144|nr:hypothetical protein [Microbacterium sp. YJN-G]